MSAVTDELVTFSLGQKRPPRSGMQMGQNENRGTEAKVERTERRVVFRERRPNEVEAPEEYSVEKCVHPSLCLKV